jgi:methylamine dehydrogenase heavy chain
MNPAAENLLTGRIRGTRILSFAINIDIHPISKKDQCMRTRRSWLLAAIALLGLGMGGAAGADPEPEPVNVELGPPSPHWVLYSMFDAQAETSKFVLIDADEARYKAWLSTGYIPSMQQSPDGRELYVADTYLDGPEHLRRDVLAFYDASDYSFSGKIEMPENSRAMMATTPHLTALVGDGRFLVLFTFTPATGIRVLDTSTRRFVSEYETPGCSLLYPTGERGVSMICGDGSLLTLHLDSSGQVAKRTMSDRFFDPNVDPIQENAAVIGGTWYFPSYDGDVYPVDLSGEEPVFGEPWSLVDAIDEPDADPPGFLARLFGSSDEEQGPWHPGGVQLMTAHAARGELYVLMHPRSMSGAANDHTFPGTEVWVYDVSTHARTRRIALESPMNQIYVTADDEPLLVAAGVSILHGVGSDGGGAYDEVVPVVSTIQIHDAVTGEYLREMKDTGITWTIEGAPGSGGVR